MLGLKSLKWLIPTLVVVALVVFVLTAPAALASSISVTPNPAWLGYPFWVTADGFHPYEIVSTWVSRPDGVAVGTGQTIADETGTVEFNFTLPYTWPQGSYRAVARGKSGLELYSDFWVNGPTLSTVTPTPTPSPAQYLGDMEGRTFIYSGTGYQPGELVWVWYTNPSGANIFYSKVYADAWGNVWFPITLGADWPFGVYHFASKGLTSKHTTNMEMGYFDGQVTGVRASDPVLGLPFVVNFTGSGFKPGEQVRMWVSLPGGGARALPQTAADANGDVNFTYVVMPGMPAGTYRIVAWGVSSHHQDYTDYDYSG
ncbi:MAG: hypothetical protein WCF84_26495 [Anaerolineae bacterium]